MKTQKIIIILMLMVVFVGCGKKVEVVEEVVVDLVEGEVKEDEVEEQGEVIEEVVVEEGDIDISDWKIYKNEEYGVEFKYPENVFVSTYTYDEIKKEEIESSDEPYYPIRFMEVSSDITSNSERWLKGESIYLNKENIKESKFPIKCEKKDLFVSCFYYDIIAGGEIYFINNLYHNDLRLDIEIKMPSEKIENILVNDTENRNEKILELLDEYIKGEFTKKEKDIVDVLKEVEKSFEFISEEGIEEYNSKDSRVYENEKYGFKFEYANDWIIKDEIDENGLFYITNQEREDKIKEDLPIPIGFFIINIFDSLSDINYYDYNSESLDKWIDEGIQDKKFIDKKLIDISGKKGFNFCFVESMTEDDCPIYVEHDNKIFQMKIRNDMYAPENLENIYDDLEFIN